MCEPDNLSPSSFAKSSSELKMPEELREFYFKFESLRSRGRILQGKGDESFGAVAAILLKKIGLSDVDVIVNNKVILLYPPYSTEEEHHWIGRIKKAHESNLKGDNVDLEAFEQFVEAVRKILLFIKGIALGRKSLFQVH